MAAALVAVSALSRSTIVPTWIDGDLVTTDPVTGKVAAIVDRLDSTHLIQQSTDARQIALPAADSAFNNAKTLPFAGGQYYLSNRAASAYNYLHDGGPAWTLAIVCAGNTVSNTNTLWSTYSFNAEASTNGALLAFNPNGTGTVIHRMARSNATMTINQSITSAWSANAPVVLRTQYTEGAATEWNIQRASASIGSGASLAAPSSGDASRALSIGARPTFDQAFTGRIALLITAPTVPSAAQIAVISAYTAVKYGVSFA